MAADGTRPPQGDARRIRHGLSERAHAARQQLGYDQSMQLVGFWCCGYRRPLSSARRRHTQHDRRMRPPVGGPPYNGGRRARTHCRNAVIETLTRRPFDGRPPTDVCCVYAARRALHIESRRCFLVSLRCCGVRPWSRASLEWGAGCARGVRRVCRSVTVYRDRSMWRDVTKQMTSVVPSRGARQKRVT